MTTQEVIVHWRKGARSALRVAVLAHEDGEQELALFHCHLAVEKALKAAIMAKTGRPHPRMHNLGRLALLLRSDWTPDEQALFDALSDFAIAARYDDPAWAKRYATARNTRRWIERTSAFLTAHRL